MPWIAQVDRQASGSEVAGAGDAAHLAQGRSPPEKKGSTAPGAGSANGDPGSSSGARGGGDGDGLISSAGCGAGGGEGGGDGAGGAGGGDGGPSGVRVLVAEDDLLSQKVMGKLLKKLGYHVRIVSDGIEAVEAFEAGAGPCGPSLCGSALRRSSESMHAKLSSTTSAARVGLVRDIRTEMACPPGPDEYDIVLMDVNMPRCGGLEATQRIRALEERLPGREGAGTPKHATRLHRPIVYQHYAALACRRALPLRTDAHGVLSAQCSADAPDKLPLPKRAAVGWSVIASCAQTPIGKETL